MGDGEKEGVFKVGEEELLLKNVCGNFEIEGKGEAVLGICEQEEGEDGGANSLVDKKSVEVTALLCEGDIFLE